jgi:hypothetical protein
MGVFEERQEPLHHLISGVVPGHRAHLGRGDC